MKNANHRFQQCIAAEAYYRHPLFKRTFTSGVKEAADQLSCYWFIDLVLSHQLRAAVSNQPFQVWKLERVKGNRFKATCTDGNDNYITHQNIPFSDFEDDTFTLWLVDGILLLPSEY